MKKTFTFTVTGCLAIVMAAAVFVFFAPAAVAQKTEVPWSIAFTGHSTDHEGVAAWDADGTGDEPYGEGHPVPIPSSWGSQPYYAASRDYDDIDPDPSAAFAHLLDSAEGFPQFFEALEANDYLISQVKFKFGLSDLGDDIEGTDWFLIGIENTPHSFYYGSPFYLVIENEPLLWGIITFNDCYLADDGWWNFETSYFRPDSIWSPYISPGLKEIGRAFLADLGDEEVRLLTTMASEGIFLGEGRNGSFYGVDGILEKGLPELPYMGYTYDHQGMAGWNADGTGPEPEADGHGAQRYYIASRDYGGIDPDPGAAFGHFLPEMKGFMNLELQMAYRGFVTGQLLIKLGLASLGNDIMGLDWGFENGTDYWCNYYDLDYKLQLAGEDIIRGLIDTSHSWMNADPVYWWCDVTYDRPRNNSAVSSPDAQIVAAAFLKDLEGRKLINDVQVMTYDTATFEGDGRYDGGYFNIETARLMAKYNDCGTFVQCDSLCSLMIDHTTWFPDHSPYFIDNDLVIDEDHTLIIQPGVEVKFRGAYFFNVKGNIQALGSEAHNVLFTHSNPNVKWNSLRIDGTPDEADSTLFEWCIFENAEAIVPAPYAYNSGGAIKIKNLSNVRFSSCIFRNNTARKNGIAEPCGGAMALWTSSPLIENTTFYSNQAWHGGAIFCFNGSNPEITNCTIYDNQVTHRGGAINIYGGSSPTISYCLIRDNYAYQYGGAVSIESSSPQLINNTIAYNVASENLGTGGGIYITGESDPDFINNILWGNTANIYNQVRIESQECTPEFQYNDIESGAEGIGPEPVDPEHYLYNIDADPIFCFPEDSMFTIATTSPCLYSGMGGAYMGAFNWGCYAFMSEEGNNDEDLVFYPNPVTTGSVLVSFFMGNPGLARLEIISLTGKKIAEPIHGVFPMGEQMQVISVESLPAGIYIGKLTVGNQSKTSKLVITR